MAPAKRERKQKKKKVSRKSKRVQVRTTGKIRAKSDVVRGLLQEIGTLEGEISDVLRTMQEKVRQFEFLTEFSSILNSSLDTEVVRERALEATCQLLACETASLFLVDEEKQELYWETALGDVGKELQRTIRLKINGESIAGFVAMTGDSLLVNDVASDPRHFSRHKKAETPKKKTGGKPAFVSKNMICVPIQSKGKVIGVLQALNKLPTVPPRKSKYDWPEFVEEEKRLLETLSNQVAIAIENSKLYSMLRRSFYETVEALAEAIEKKDRYTGGHTKRVVFYSMAICKHMDLSQEQLERIRLGAILHDVGKIGIEDKILKKPAPLDEKEWPVMKEHPELGYHIMKRAEGLRDVVDGMRYHHERWDGKGYPVGLRGEEIPLIARIIAIADTYDAMVSTRPYRKGLDPKIAYNEIMKNAGTQFCPTTAQAFHRAFVNGDMGRQGGETGEVDAGETEEIA